MNRPDHDATILASLERFCSSFVGNLAAWRALDKSKRPARALLLPQSVKSYSSICSIRIIYLAAVSHSCIQGNKTLTKRDVYYMCPILFPNPATVDRALKALSSIVGVHPNDLNLVAAPKGLVVGNVSFVDESANEIKVHMFGGHGCLIPSRPERMTHVSMNAAAIVVYDTLSFSQKYCLIQREIGILTFLAFHHVYYRRIEKEAAFNWILQEETSREFLTSCVLVTGKGYPDHATRHFLKRLIVESQLQGKNVSTFILTDADPHGLCIAMCYISSLCEHDVKWLGVKPSDNAKEFLVEPRSLLPLKEPEIVLLNSLLERCSHESLRAHKEYCKLRDELSFIKKIGTKFEMEALIADHSSWGTSGLLDYLISKIWEQCGASGSL